jgi:hypothetical protein
MSGETNLDVLLRSMKPELQEGEFVFCTVSPERVQALNVDPVCQFREDEGVTLIVRKEQAEGAGLSYAFVSRMITLTVHSSLDAVGFLAAVAGKLAENGISVNPVSAYYHDHLFVPSEKAAEVIGLLAGFSEHSGAVCWT